MMRLVTFITLANYAAGIYFEDVKIKAQVTNHLAETTLVMKIHNDGACPTDDTFDLQLPVTSFLSEMILTEEKTNCTFTGTFLPEEKAQAGFDGAVKAGDSAALIKSYAVGKVTLSLSVPAKATSTLTIAYTEVLRKESGKVRLQLPINFAGRKVTGDIQVVVSVREPSGIDDIKCSASAHSKEINIPNTAFIGDFDKRMFITIPTSDRVVGGKFSSVITCVYTPNAIPNGILLVDPIDRHFFYLYAPATQGVSAVSKAINFVIDVSGSMSGQRLKDAKRAFKYMVSLLTPNDYFSVSTFSSSVTSGAFGPTKASQSKIEEAGVYIDSLRADGGTNLHDAVVKGIAHARSLLDSDGKLTPVLLLLTDGQASSGVTNGRQIVADSLKENIKKEQPVPVYSLALGRGADYQLLQAISTSNGGDTLQVHEGFGDSIDQMQSFYEDNLKHILMRQVQVELSNALVQSITDLTFPILNAGTEILVTGQLQVAEQRRALSNLLQFGARIKGMGPDGPFSLTTKAKLTPEDVDGQRVSRSITRMHSYRKVRELMRYSQADAFMGHNERAAAQRAKALNITLEAGLLWPGLTSMLVLADDTCRQRMQQKTEACTTTPPRCDGQSIKCVNPEGGLEEDAVAPPRGGPVSVAGGGGVRAAGAGAGLFSTDSMSVVSMSGVKVWAFVVMMVVCMRL